MMEPAQQQTDTQNIDQQQSTDTQNTEVERPEWLPEKFWSQDVAGNWEDIAKNVSTSYVNAEKVMSQKKEEFFKEFEEGRLSQRPESPESYALNLDAEALGAPKGTQIRINDDDPMLSWWRNTAYENGLSQEQFNMGVEQYMRTELGALGDMDKEREALGENAQDRINRVEQWARKNVGDEMFNAIQYKLGDATSVKFLEKLMEKTGGIDLSNIDESSNAGRLTEGEIKQMMDDPRYWRDRDPVYIKRVEDAWKSLS